MAAVFPTDRVTVGDGFAVLRENFSQWRDPVEVSAEEPAGFRSHLRRAALGAVTVGSHVTSGRVFFQVHRPQRLIRQSDPETYRFFVSVDGHTLISQAGRDALLGPGDIGFHDSSRSTRGSRCVHADSARLLTVAFPRALLPVHPDRVRELTGVTLPGTSPIAALVTSTVARVAEDFDRYSAADSTRLSTTVVDLFGALLGHTLDAQDVVEPDSRRRALLAQVQAFIEGHLDDPTLSPNTVGAAHYLAPRTLDRLFREQELTVAGWIRHRRLERCRRDLADPRLAGQPIYAIATQFGFVDGPHLTRAFKAAYGMSPQEYRRENAVSALSEPVGPDARDRAVSAAGVRP